MNPKTFVVLPLEGTAGKPVLAWQAIERFLSAVGKSTPCPYEIQLRYANGNVLTGTFHDKESAVAFLRSYRPVVQT